MRDLCLLKGNMISINEYFCSVCTPLEAFISQMENAKRKKNARNNVDDQMKLVRQLIPDFEGFDHNVGGDSNIIDLSKCSRKIWSDKEMPQYKLLLTILEDNQGKISMKDFQIITEQCCCDFAK